MSPAYTSYVGAKSSQNFSTASNVASSWKGICVSLTMMTRAPSGADVTFSSVNLRGVSNRSASASSFRAFSAFRLQRWLGQYFAFDTPVGGVNVQHWSKAQVTGLGILEVAPGGRKGE